MLIDYFFSGLWLSDVHNGFRALSSVAGSQINIRQDRMAHASEIIQEIVRNKLRYIEVPVHIRYTEYSLQKGQGSLGALKILKDLFFAGLSKK